jgi:hypothetical protein
MDQVFDLNKNWRTADIINWHKRDFQVRDEDSLPTIDINDIHEELILSGILFR